MNTNYSKQQARPQTHGNHYSTYNKAKGKRYNNIGAGTILGSTDEVQLLSKGQEQRANHLYSKVAENDTLTVKKDEASEFYFQLVKHHFQNDQSQIRLEALGGAIPNLVLVTELIELSGMAKKTKIKSKEVPLEVEQNGGKSHLTHII